jgi:hypothetical protein
LGGPEFAAEAAEGKVAKAALQQMGGAKSANTGMIGTHPRETQILVKIIQVHYGHTHAPEKPGQFGIGGATENSVPFA